MLKVALLPIIMVFFFGGSLLLANKPRRLVVGIMFYLVSLSLVGVLIAKPWIVLGAVAGVIALAAFMKLSSQFKASIDPS